MTDAKAWTTLLRNVGISCRRLRTIIKMIDNSIPSWSFPSPLFLEKEASFRITQRNFLLNQTKHEPQYTITLTLTLTLKIVELLRNAMLIIDTGTSRLFGE